MNTVKSIKIIVSLLVLGTLGACEDWLDVEPTTQNEADLIFEFEDGFRDVLAGSYTLMSGTGLYGRELTFGALDVMAGYYDPYRGGISTYYNLYHEYPYEMGNSSNPSIVNIVDGFWKGLYKTVANTNSLLEYVDDKKTVFNDDHYRLIKGEAIGLRAFLHFDLLRLYGPAYSVNPNKEAIPFITELSSDITALSTVDEALAQIISDLEQARSLMENDPILTGETPSDILASPVATIPSVDFGAVHNRKYRFNYYAVTATLARAYQWKGDKVNALKYAREIIDVQEIRYPWVSDDLLAEIADENSAEQDRTFASEHIFALNIRALSDYYSNHFTSEEVNGQGLYLTADKRTALFEGSSVDPRNQYLFEDYEIGETYFPSKFYQNSNVLNILKQQMPMIRISEMYYIAAESAPTVAEGVDYLNQIREARKLEALTDITTQEDLNSQIQNEVQKEFLGEGQLWFYYKRHNLQELPFAPFFTDTNKYVFDLPEEEISLGSR